MPATDHGFFGSPPLVGLWVGGRDAKSVQRAFDSWADWYDDSALQASLFLPVRDTVLQQLHLYAPQGGRLLDVGCGTGRLIAVASGLYPFCVGVDPCHRLLKQGRGRQVPGMQFVRARAEQLPFAAGSYDVVTSTMSLRHWQDPARGLRELSRVLAPDGVLVLADADLDDKASSPRRRRGFHASRYPRLATLLVASGLSVMDHRLAPVHGPVPRVHVISARARSASLV